MNSSCVVCGSTKASPLYRGILKCEGCEFVYADLHLSDSDCQKIYHRNYFFGEEYYDYVADCEVLEKNFSLRLKVLQRFIDPSRHKRLLEIGSAYGFFLRVAKDYFEKVQGIDITEDGVRYCVEQLGLPAICSDLLQADLRDQQFDVVCLWDTIEHLLKPHYYLDKIGRHMASGALLAITTGDIESFTARYKKERWRLIHPPTHAHYFSKRTIKQLLDRCGFDVVYNRYCGFYRSGNNSLYNLLVLRYGRPSLYELIRKTGFGRLSFYLNLYDIMFVIARRR